MSAFSAVVRKSPGALLREFADLAEINLPDDFDWEVTDAKLAEPLIGAISKLEQTQHDRVLSNAERVHALSDEPGQVAGLFPALGRPIHIVQSTGGSDQPSHGETHLALPIAEPATDRTDART